MSATQPVPTWRDLVTRDEIDAWLRMNDWKSAASVALDWGIIFAAMVLVAVWTNPLTIVAALFLIGARQLGIAVLMHEASHRSFLTRGNAGWAIAVGYPVCEPHPLSPSTPSPPTPVARPPYWPVAVSRSRGPSAGRVADLSANRREFASRRSRARSGVGARTVARRAAHGRDHQLGASRVLNCREPALYCSAMRRWETNTP